MAIDTSGMITVAEAARRLGRSQEQVRRRLREGSLKGQRIGNQWFVEAESVAPRRESYLDPELIERILTRRAAINRRVKLPAIDEMIRDSREDQ